MPLGDWLNLGGSVLGGVADYFSARSTNDANRDIANKANAFSQRMANSAMAFQERMSNTQYQRAVSDMRAAGLNPMLAYSQGGAGNLSGFSAMGNTGAPQQNPVHGAVHSALSAFKNSLDYKANLALLQKTKADIANTNQDTRIKKNTANVTQIEGDIADSIWNRAVKPLASSIYNSAKSMYNNRPSVKIGGFYSRDKQGNLHSNL